MDSRYWETVWPGPGVPAEWDDVAVDGVAVPDVPVCSDAGVGAEDVAED